MRNLGWAIAAGVAGNALFALLTRWAPFVEGPAWWWSMAAVFLVFSAGTIFLLPAPGPAKRKIKSVASASTTDDSLEADLKRVVVRDADEVNVLSGNKSKGSMKLTGEDIDLS